MDNVEQAIEVVVQTFVAAGLLDDKAFAQTKARSLHRRGASNRLTRQRLQAAGVDQDTVDHAMASLDDELGADPASRELRAAAAFAWQAGGGVIYEITERLTFDIGYRYVQLGSIAYADPSSGASSSFSASELMFGLRLYEPLRRGRR